MTLKQIKDYPQSGEYAQAEAGFAQMCRGRQEFATSLGTSFTVSAAKPNTPTM